jgi:hypothetical protein
VLFLPLVSWHITPSDEPLKRIKFVYANGHMIKWDAIKIIIERNKLKRNQANSLL